MKFFILTVMWFSAFFGIPNNAHEKPYKAEAIDPMEYWFSLLEKNAWEAGKFGAITGNVTRLETLAKSACSTGIITNFSSFYKKYIQTLAECAVFAGSPDILQLMYDCGLKFNKDPLFAVITHHYMSNKADLVKTLYKNPGTINLDDDTKLSLLKFAFDFGEIALIEMLLTNGIDVNVRLSRRNNTLLHEICWFKSNPLLIDSRYPTINDKDNNLRKVRFELLLKFGADINAINSKGSTPIHLCAMSGNQEAAKMLVNAGADVNIQSEKGFTPLFLAFAMFVYNDNSQASAEMIKLLVQNGAVLKKNQFYDGLHDDRAYQKYMLNIH